MTHLTPEANQALYADQSGLSLDDQLQTAFERNLESGTATLNALPDSLSLLAATAVAEAQAQLPETSALANLEPAFADTVRQSHDQINDLLRMTKTGLTVPELASPELYQVDWVRLQTGYDVMAAAGLTPRLIIAPVGRSVDFWKELYNNLCDWQNEHHPATDNYLDKSPFGRLPNDCLIIDPELKQNWAKLIPTTAGWTASVIPATAVVPFENLDHSGHSDNSSAVDTLQHFLERLPTARTTEATPPNPSVERYLTMQALHLLNNEPVLDSDDVFNRHIQPRSRTWLSGISITISSADQPPYNISPAAKWIRGQVVLASTFSDHHQAGIGIRPEIVG